MVRWGRGGDNLSHVLRIAVTLRSVTYGGILTTQAVLYPHHRNSGDREGRGERGHPSGFSLIRCLHPLPECAGWKRSQLILTDLQAPATCPQEMSLKGQFHETAPRPFCSSSECRHKRAKRESTRWRRMMEVNHFIPRSLAKNEDLRG